MMEPASRARAVAALVVALAAGLVGAGCAGPRPDGGPAGDAPAARFGTVTVTEADAGRRIVALRGQRIEVRLASRPGRGYTVRLGSVIEPTLARDGPVRYVDDAEYQVRDGATNFEVWRFRAQASGETALRFDFRRDWETTGPAGLSVEFPVQVR